MKVDLQWSAHGGGSHKPNRIIVHSMAESVPWDADMVANYGFPEDEGRPVDAVTLLDRLGLSAHIIVPPAGNPIRLRRDNEIAWHAKGHNFGTLGIEFLVPGCWSYTNWRSRIDEIGWLPDPAFESGAAVIADWLNQWDVRSIDRHSDIDPERKADPGNGFPWQRLLNQLGV